MERLTQLPDRLANWKTIAMLILIALPFNLVIFPMRSARLKKLAGNCNPIILVGGKSRRGNRFVRSRGFHVC
jgi:hypothetical protein